MLVHDVVALEDDTIFVLPSGVSFRQFRPFFGHQAKNSPEVDFGVFPPGNASNFVELAHLCRIPNSFFLEVVPLLGFRILSIFLSRDLVLAHWTSYARMHEVGERHPVETGPRGSLSVRLCQISTRGCGIQQ